MCSNPTKSAATTAAELTYSFHPAQVSATATHGAATESAHSDSHKSSSATKPSGLVGACYNNLSLTTATSNNPPAAQHNHLHHQHQPPRASSMLAIPGGLLPIDHFRLKLYNYAMVERLRCAHQGGTGVGGAGQMPLCPQPLNPGSDNPANRVAAAAAAAAIGSPYGHSLALSMSLFQNRMMFQNVEEPKPQHSYIGLIAMAILGSPDRKLVLSDIYQHILDNYPYFRSRGPGWRNSIRHNLSLNDCFVKAGRSANGKGHYWAVHPANIDDFKKGDFRRRKAQRKVRKHMGLAVDDGGTDSPSPPPLNDPFASAWTMSQSATTMDVVTAGGEAFYHHHHHQQQHPQHLGLPFPIATHAHPFHNPFHAHTVIQRQHQIQQIYSAKLTSTTMHQTTSGGRKRQFDVASLLAPDEEIPTIFPKRNKSEARVSSHSNDDVILYQHQQTVLSNEMTATGAHTDLVEENIDVEANDFDEDELSHREDEDNCSPSSNNSLVDLGNTSPVNADLIYRDDSGLVLLQDNRKAVVDTKQGRLVESQDNRTDIRYSQQERDGKFPWDGLPAHWTNLPSAGVDRKFLERYYGQCMSHKNNNVETGGKLDGHSGLQRPASGDC